MKDIIYLWCLSQTLYPICHGDLYRWAQYHSLIRPSPIISEFYPILFGLIISFSKINAQHPTIPLPQTISLHVNAPAAFSRRIRALAAPPGMWSCKHLSGKLQVDWRHHQGQSNLLEPEGSFKVMARSQNTTREEYVLAFGGIEGDGRQMIKMGLNDPIKICRSTGSFLGQKWTKNMERFTNLRVILAQGPC